MPRIKRAVWWKMHYYYRLTVEQVSDEAAGQALKAALRYFDGEDVDPEQLPGDAKVVFGVMKSSIDDAINDYEKSVTDGKAGGLRRWRNR